MHSRITRPTDLSLRWAILIVALLFGTGCASSSDLRQCIGTLLRIAAIYVTWSAG
jgi:hypothetical protein